MFSGCWLWIVRRFRVVRARGILDCFNFPTTRSYESCIWSGVWITPNEGMWSINKLSWLAHPYMDRQFAYHPVPSISDPPQCRWREAVKPLQDKFYILVHTVLFSFHAAYNRSCGGGLRDSATDDPCSRSWIEVVIQNSKMLSLILEG